MSTIAKTRRTLLAALQLLNAQRATLPNADELHDADTVAELIQQLNAGTATEIQAVVSDGVFQSASSGSLLGQMFSIELVDFDLMNSDPPYIAHPQGKQADHEQPAGAFVDGHTVIPGPQYRLELNEAAEDAA